VIEGALRTFVPSLPFVDNVGASATAMLGVMLPDASFSCDKIRQYAHALRF
jgi:hypothetical protein